jgi:hypothetical protein
MIEVRDLSCRRPYLHRRPAAFRRVELFPPISTCQIFQRQLVHPYKRDNALR